MFWGTEIDGKTLGTIGVEAIDSQLASAMASLDMQVGGTLRILVEKALCVLNTLTGARQWTLILS